MVEFKGNVAPKNVGKQLKLTSRMLGLSIIIICAVLSFIALILVVSGVGTFEGMKEAIISCGVTICLGILVIFIPMCIMDTTRGRATTVEIDETRIRCERPYHALPFVEISIYEVKRVYDYGECYYIIYTDMAQAIICQKDLLKQGTLEEFEALFEGKIKRRYRKKQ